MIRVSGDYSTMVTIMQNHIFFFGGGGVGYTLGDVKVTSKIKLYGSEILT